eukprot:SM000136S00157  [mRNA]  locus=s136:49310:51741:- [translate_table: standard]
MPSPAWEAHAGALANAPGPADVVRLVREIAAVEGVDFATAAARRGPAAAEGVSVVPGVAACDLGILTTPQLHWMVRAANRGEPRGEADYFAALASGFRELVRLPDAREGVEAAAQRQLVVDAACGVGAPALAALAPLVARAGLTVEIRNVPGAGGGALNDGVGADFVQKERQPPAGFNDVGAASSCASLDGDADRLVYFYDGGHRGFRLLDGDKIAALVAAYVIDQLRAMEPAGLDGATSAPRVGIVQTAYANGAATAFARDGLSLAVVTTPTGVKHLHGAAEAFDVGIYYEANGHGTVLFSEPFLVTLADAAAGRLGGGPAAAAAAVRLLGVSRVANQAVGDGLSGILLVEAALAARQWSLVDWDAMYDDLPSRQLKVRVTDRRQVVTTPEETCVLRPPGLQAAIDAEIAKHELGRAFVRPSGTEDVVRVYAEAATQASADKLALAAACAVHAIASGLGPPPELAT